MKRLALLLITGLLLFAQTGDPPDDPNPEWEGQKAWCNDLHSTPHGCHCAKATSCPKKGEEPDLYGDGDAEMGTKCQTHCRAQHCHCAGGCTT